jgi:putative oxidoreductase
MKSFTGRFSPQLYAVLRIVTGLLFAVHGTQKLFGWPGGSDPVPMGIFKVAGVIELVTGLLVAIGFLTSFAAFIAAGQMAVAYFWKHAPNGFWPVLNQGEAAVLFCFLFLYIAAQGAGIWGVDSTRVPDTTPRSSDVPLGSQV